jgi:hypothetical protein
MFDIEICDQSRIGFVRFYGELGEADFDALDAIGRAGKDGPAYDIVCDMSGVEQAHLATDSVSKRGRLPQANPGRSRV